MIWFLPAGLAGAIIVSLLFPQPGDWLNSLGLLPWIIAGIFLINGYQTRVADARVGDGFGLALMLATVISFIIAPLIGWLSFLYLPLSSDLLIGLVVMCVVPPTLSSCVVLTRLVNGHAQWSLWFTLILNFLGILTIPMTLSLIIGKNVDIDGWQLLIKLSLMVALPFSLGMIARSFKRNAEIASAVKQLPTVLVIIGVWMTLSSNSTELLQISAHNLFIILFVSTIIHSILLFVCWLVGPAFRLPYDQHMAILFTASQKTMPIAVSVVIAVNPTLGVAVIACVTFHTVQMMIDSSLAGIIKKGRLITAEI